MKSASKTIFVTILTDATRGIHVDQENNINVENIHEEKVYTT